MLALMLLASLFLFFYCLTVRELPGAEAVKVWAARYGAGGACAVGFFAGAALLWGPLAGIPWGVLGWRLPAWVLGAVERRRRARLAAMARDFVSAAAGMYAAGQTTPEVVRQMAGRFAEPLASDFSGMIAARNANPNASFPAMFAELGRKYGLPEFEAVSKIVAASERAGGPAAAARGLKRLGQALRQKDRLAAERLKATLEPRIAAVVTVAILGAGLLLDGTVLRPYFAGGGRLVLAAASGLVVGLLFMLQKISRSEDLV